MELGKFGVILLAIGLGATFLTIVSYALHLWRPASQRTLWAGRVFYTLSALGIFGTFCTLASLIVTRNYHYEYVWSHTSNELHHWYRFAATWGGQEGSFLLWGAWTALIGFLVLAKAGKYEARVMPFYVITIGFLCAILLKQTPFNTIPPLSPEMPQPPNGMGLNPSLQNYWMTIHPPTIFFGFASLLVPFCYSVAALIWKDYEGWAARIMPYGLLSVATLGGGLFMGGYWAYETQGWHGFWAWDPVENASFFPWLAVTALAHGLVVQRSRGGMGRTNTFLGILGYWLFLVGTFLTRSGALAKEGPDGNLLSVHAFGNTTESGLWLMATMLISHGVIGFGLWLFRLRSIPTRDTKGDTLVSRDFAFFVAVSLMIVACFVVALGTTQPLFMSWLKRPPTQPEASFYNRVMMPIAMLTALGMGCVPWLAWRKTNPDSFLKKLLIPWLVMVAFGFGFLFWVFGQERAVQAAIDMSSIETTKTLNAWGSPIVQRLSVVTLAALAFLAALSNALLSARIFRSKPITAGGWLAHVGMGVFILGVIVSNTYERTTRLTLVQDEGPKEAFGYKFEFEKMTGKPLDIRPINPEYDQHNAVQIRVTPPGSDGKAKADGSPSTFLIQPRWFVHNLHQKPEDEFQRMRWPHIEKFALHDLYVGFASDPGLKLAAMELEPAKPIKVGPYELFYLTHFGEPMKQQGAVIYIKSEDGKVVETRPALKFEQRTDAEGKPAMGMLPMDVAIPEIKDEQGNVGAIYLRSIDAKTKKASILLSLPGFSVGTWEVPIEITYKPWINLVWIGVILAVAGTFLAMVRRALEARKITDAIPNPGLEEDEPEETPEKTRPKARPELQPQPVGGRAFQEKRT